MGISTLDTRDLEEQQADLESEKEDLIDKLKEAVTNLKIWKRDNQKELEELRGLAESIQGYDDGVTLISEDDFVEYCQELCEDLGYISKDAHFITIDWEATADNIRQDYSSIEYDDQTWLYRE